MKVKIDRSSIRKNPNAGRETTHIPGHREISGTWYGEVPKGFKDHLLITESEFPLDSAPVHQFILVDNHSEILPSLFELTKQGKCTLEIVSEPIVMHHLPEPEYLFKYENPLLVCEECGKPSNINDIPEDEDSEGNLYTECPLCGADNSFEHLTYETIDEALANP